MGNWGKTDMGKTLAQYEQDAAAYGADFFEFKDGENEVRICPPGPDDDGLPFVVRATHFRVGEANKRFNCPKAADKDADCFICDRVKELRESGDEDDEEQAEELRAKKQWLYRIIDMSNVRKGIQVMAVGIKTHLKIRSYLHSKDYGDITDIEEGFNLIIEKSGSGLKTTYEVRARRNPEDVTEIIEDLEAPDLAKLTEPASNKAMKAAWEGTDEEEDKKAKVSRPKAQRRAVEDDEPRRRRVAEDDEPRRAAVVEDDDEDDDEEDEKPRRAAKDEDEKPRGRKLATSSRSRSDD